MSAYDKLLKRVTNLKQENTQLRSELQDNSCYLSKLENEASNMKDVLSVKPNMDEDHDDVYDDYDEEGIHDFVQGGGGESRDVNHNDEDVSPNDSGPVNPPQLPHPGDTSEGDERERSQGPTVSKDNGGPKTHSMGDIDYHTFLRQLNDERNLLLNDIEEEDKHRKWYYEQLEVIGQKIDSLHVSDKYNRQTDMARRQLEFEAKRVQDSFEQTMGDNEQIVQRQEARLNKIQAIEKDMLHLQQQQHKIQLERSKNGPQEEEGVETDGDTTLLQEEQSVEDESLSNDVSIATQTAAGRNDAANMTTNEDADSSINLSSLYHGAWPLTPPKKELEFSRKGDSTQNSSQSQDLASIMSFNSMNTTNSQGSDPSQPPPVPPQQPTVLQQDPVAGAQHPQQLGTKVEMVYSLLSMLGTHDKDDMSRTLLAMSSSQDSCIAMRQSGCMPLLIQLLHGSDKDSGLLGNTRGSKSARARAAAALHNIVHSHPDDKRGRREARVLRLLEQIRAHCDQLRESPSDEEEEGRNNSKSGNRTLDMDHHPGPAVAALMKLSFDEEHRHAICSLGGVQAIAELIEVDNEINGHTTEQYNITMRRYGCMALTNLTFGDGTNKALLCSMKGFMEALVGQLQPSCEDLCQVAASVLRNLSWKADLASKKTLREVGAGTTLMKASMAVKKEATLKSILSALWNLSAHGSENKADICAVEGALEFLVSTLTYKSPSKTMAVVENGGGILRNVSSHITVREDYRQILRRHGCLQILLKQLRSTSLTIVSNACGTLWNLSARCVEDQKTLWDMGAVGMLRNLVNSKHQMISMGSSAALKNLLAACPSIKDMKMDQKSHFNRPTLHVRKQRALEAEIDQSLSETCENLESPRDSPTENTRTTEKDQSRFVFPSNVNVINNDTEPHRPVARGPIYPRSKSGECTPVTESKLRSPQRVSRSGSQDSVGSTHSDISHDRNRFHYAMKSAKNFHDRQGGSLDRKHGIALQKFNSEGHCERSMHGNSNRILQVMQEVAQHAGIDSGGTKVKSSESKPSHIPVPRKDGNFSLPHTLLYRSFTNPSLPQHMPHLMENAYSSPGYGMPPVSNGQYQNYHDDDEQPIDYSMKYDNGQNKGNNQPSRPQPPPPLPPKYNNFMGPNHIQMYPVMHHSYSGPPMNPNIYQMRPHIPMMHPMVPVVPQFNSYAETDLDNDQPTDFSVRYAEQDDNQSDQPVSYSMQYRESDPNCTDCKLEAAIRTSDQYVTGFNEDQTMTFYTEGTPLYNLSTATSMTDLSNRIHDKEDDTKEKAESKCDSQEDETRSYGSRFNEVDKHSGSGSKLTDSEKQSRADSHSTDQQTGTTVIQSGNHGNKNTGIDQENSHLAKEDSPERSFHIPADDDHSEDQVKTYCEEGTPICFSRVSSLSSLHSSEAQDRQENKPRQQMALQSIEETERGKTPPRPALKNSPGLMNAPKYTPITGRQKLLSESDMHSDDVSEKEHKTVTFDDNHQVEETPLMFSRCSSLSSLGSFDAFSVHSDVVSEYSRRASEVVSPSELPDSPSETMPPSPKHGKSPELFADKINSVRKVKKEVEKTPAEPVVLKDFISTNMNVVNSFKPVPKNKPVQDSDHSTLETDSVISKDAPVVYADEGTPPKLSDTNSVLSALTFDEQHSCKDNEISKCGTNEMPKTYNHHVYEEKHSDTPTKKGLNISQAANQSLLNQSDDKENSSMSEVSEGEEDILAQCISSAMPISAKKMRRSSSDNTIKKKTSITKLDNQKNKSNIKPTGTVAKPKAVKRLSDFTKESVHEGSEDCVTSFASEDIPPSCESYDRPKHSKSKGMIRSGSAPVDIQSNKSFTSEKNQSSGTDNIRQQQSNLRQQSNIGQQQGNIGQQQGNIRQQSNIGQQQGNLRQQSNIGQQQGNIRQQSNIGQQQGNIGQPQGNIGQPQGNIRQQQGNLRQPQGNIGQPQGNIGQPQGNIGQQSNIGQPQGNIGQPQGNIRQQQGNLRQPQGNIGQQQGNIRQQSYAQKAQHLSKLEIVIRDDLDGGDSYGDCVKSYATEDTPFTQSAAASPGLDKSHIPNLDSSQCMDYVSKIEVHVNDDAVKSYAMEGTPYNGSIPTSPKPETKNQNANFKFKYVEAEMPAVEVEDTVKAYATEDTPLNFSRTTSLSDLSIITTNTDNIDNKSPPKSESVAPALDDSHDQQSDNSSLVDESDELLSELIQSAMPKGKVSRRLDMDRAAEGSETIDTFKFASPPFQQNETFEFKPQRTSSHVVPHNPMFQADCPKVYAVEGTPLNFSNATSLSDLTIDSHEPVAQSKKTVREFIPSSTDQSSASHVATFGTSADDSVFMHTESSDSLKMYNVEGTPQTFSRNDSLSSLSIMDEDTKDLEKLKKLCETSQTTKPHQSDITQSHWTKHGYEILQREVEGQSSDETKSAKGTEDKFMKPANYSHGSSLSSIPSQENQELLEQKSTELPREDSLSSLSSDSGDDDPESEEALLDECISSALPKSRSENKSKIVSRIPKVSQDNVMSASFSGRGGSTHSLTQRDSRIPPENARMIEQQEKDRMSRSCSSMEEMEDLNRSFQQYTHQSRITTWRKEMEDNRPEEFQFAKPADESLKRGAWRRSRSQDSDGFLKRQKNHSNMELAKSYNSSRDVSDSPWVLRSSADNIPSGNTSLDDNRVFEEIARFTQSRLVEGDSYQQTSNRDSAGSLEKVDREKPEIQDANGQESQYFGGAYDNYGFDENAASDNTDSADITVVNPESANITMTNDNSGGFDVTFYEPEYEEGALESPNCSFEDEISPEDEQLLEANASLIVSEIQNTKMTGSSVDEDMFIENETLSLVSGGYTSDTASEVSLTWSAKSEHLSEFSESTTISNEDSSISTGAKIVKPSNRQVIQDVENPKAVRGRRKPLYSPRSAPNMQKAPVAKIDTNLKKGTNRSSSTGKITPNVTNNKKLPQRTTSHPQACSTPTRAPPKSKTPGKPSPPQQSNKTALNKSPNSKNSPPSRLPTATSRKGGNSVEKPKPPIKQRTFIKDSPSTNAPVIDMNDSLDENGNDTSITENNVSLTCSKPDGNSPDIDSECWSKALESYNFVVENEKDQKNSRSNQIGQKTAVKGNNTGNNRTQNGGTNVNKSKSGINTAAGKQQNKLNKSNNISNLKKTYSGTSLTKSGSGASLNKSGSGASLNKSGSSLNKTGSGTLLNKSGSGANLNKTGSNPNLKKASSKGDLKKSSSNASLKSNSRPSTPVGRKNSNSSQVTKKTDNQSNKSSQQSSNTTKKLENPTNKGIALTPENRKASGTGAVSKKLVNSKIAGTKKKDETDSPGRGSTSKLPVSTNSANTSPRGQQNKDKMIPQTSYSVSNQKASASTATARAESPYDGLSRSSTYDKLDSTNDSSCLPCLDEHVSVTQTVMSNSYTSNTKETREYVDMNKSVRGDKSSPDNDFDLKSLEKRIDTSTWKKKKPLNEMLCLPNADETAKSLEAVRAVLNASILNESSMINASVNDSVFTESFTDKSMTGSSWRRYKEDSYSSCAPSDDEESIWVRRDADTSRSEPQLSKFSIKEKKQKRKSKGEGHSFLPIKAVKQMFSSKKKSASNASLASSRDSNLDKSDAEDGKSSLKRRIFSKKKSDKKSTEKVRNGSVSSLEVSKTTSPQSALVPPFNYTPSSTSTTSLSRSSSSQLNTSQLNTSQLNTSQLNTSQLNTSQLNTSKLNTSQLNTSHLNTSQLNKSQLNTSQLNTSHLNTSQLNTSQLNKSQLNTSQLNTSHLDTSHLNASQLNTSQLNASQLNTSTSQSTELNDSRDQDSVFVKPLPVKNLTTHATKTEMLLARRRQSYLNSLNKAEGTSEEDKKRQGCMVTTV